MIEENIFGIKRKLLKSIILTIKKNKKVREIILFGSRAKNSHATGSDIDIAIKGEGLEIEELLSIKNALENFNIPNKIDLIIYEKIENQDLKEHIDRVGIKLEEI